MRVYHGSNIAVQSPKVTYSATCLDFGQGFYLTTVQQQAERWARRKANLKGSPQGIVNVFEFTHTSRLRTLNFADDLDAWIDFVCACRDGGEAFRNYDVIMGKVADDKVFRVVDLYKRGIWDRARAIQEMRVYPSYDQIALISQQTIDEQLTYIQSYEVTL